MIVICTAECEKKALQKTKRILCQYLPQIGRRTWVGKISQEGLEDLYHALRKVATKQSSIACHRVRGTKRSELQWIIGNRNNFDETGIYAYSTLQSKILPVYKNLSRPQKILRIILQLAALFHDLGKATVGFQKKLAENSRKPDAIRHEFVSCMILKQVIGECEGDDWLFKFCQAEQIKQLFSEGLKDKFLKHEVIDKQLFYLDQLDRKPITIWIQWLILTHHQLPDGQKDVNRLIYTAYIRKKELGEIKNFLQIASGKKPWEEKNWLSCVSDLCSQLMNELKPTPEESKALAPYILYYARPCLVYGDYLASEKRVVSNNKFGNYIVYANTKEKKPADTLTQHLLSAKSWSRKYFTCLHDYEHHLPQLRSTDISSLPDLSKHVQIKKYLSSDNFAWQQDAVNKILQQNVQDQPFFGIIVAATGTGKTQGAMKIMAALGEFLRYTLGLGLRTLTLQTGKVYSRELKIPKSECAIIVGKKISQQLIEKTAHEDQEIDEKEGVGNFELNALDENHYVDAVGYEDEQNELFDIAKAKEKDIVKTPILITTVDHIIRSAELIRSRESLMMLRVMTSDLVLDEIDSYNPEDLISLGKLVYLTGLFGKRVLLLSATLSPVIAESFYKAYRKGVEQYQQFNEKSIKTPIVGLFSNYYECTVIKKEIDNFTIEYREFIDSIVPFLNNEAPKHRCEILNNQLSSNDDIPNYPKILNACFQLHLSNNTLINGIRVSIGFVRWNTVKECRNFAYWLYSQKQPDDFQYALICYHARLTLLDRYQIESFLDRVLHRKNNFSTLADNSEEIQRVIEKARNLKKSHVVLIVVTNPIQETGRDHDYDWAILEPCSTRSIIQSAGRVQRHRHFKLQENNFNIYLMQYPSRYLRKKERVWGYPGIETLPFSGKPYFPLLKKIQEEENKVLIAQLTHAGITSMPLGQNTEFIFSSDEAFHIKRLRDKINALLCLTIPENYSDSPITALEFAQLHQILLNEKNPDSLHYFLNAMISQLHRLHAKNNRFRRKHDTSSILYPIEIMADGYYAWYELVSSEKNSSERRRDEIKTDSLLYSEYALLNYNLPKTFEEEATKLNLSIEDYQAHKVLCQLEIPGQIMDKIHSVGLVYHPLLGLGEVEP